MAQLSLDELNALTKDSANVIPIKKYFQEMEITDEQKNARILLAEKIANIILLALIMIQSDIKVNNTPDEQYYKDFLHSWIQYLISDMGIIVDNELFDAINTIIDETVENSIKEKQIASEADRAISIAEDMSNLIQNEQDFLIALREGKTYKTWITKQDNLVRKTHRSLDGNTIPINNLFIVGNGARMRFPCDTKYGYYPKEIIRCRCSCEYS